MGVRHESAFSPTTGDAGVKNCFAWLALESVRDWNGCPAWAHSFSISTRRPWIVRK